MNIMDLDPLGIELINKITRPRKEYEKPEADKYMLMTSRWLAFRMIPTALEIAFALTTLILYRETDLSLLSSAKKAAIPLFLYAEGLRASELLGMLGYRILRRYRL